MDYWEKYKDLIIRINIQKEIILSLENQAYGLKLQTNNESCNNNFISDMPKGKKVNPDLEIVLSKLIEVNKKLEIEKQVLDELLKSKERIETYIAALDGLQHKVAYLKIIADKDTDYISKTLGLSKGYVKNILTQVYVTFK